MTTAEELQAAVNEHAGDANWAYNLESLTGTRLLDLITAAQALEQASMDGTTEDEHWDTLNTALAAILGREAGDA